MNKILICYFGLSQVTSLKYIAAIGKVMHCYKNKRAMMALACSPRKHGTVKWFFGKKIIKVSSIAIQGNLAHTLAAMF